MINKTTFKIGNSPGLLYVFITILLLSAVSLFQIINSAHIALYYYSAVIISLGLGIIHIRFTGKLNDASSPGEFYSGITLTGLIIVSSAIVDVVLCILYNLPVSFLSYLVAFLLPFLVRQAYFHFLQIPPVIHKVWYYPFDTKTPEFSLNNLAETFTVPFVLNKDPRSFAKTKLSIESPVDMTVGRIFFNLLDIYNTTNDANRIEFLDPANNPYGWLFFVKRKWFNQRQYIDPDLSISENMMRPREIIYATRSQKS